MGFLLTAGVLLKMFLFGWQKWMAAVLAASIVIIIVSIPAIKARLDQSLKIGGRVIAAAAFAALLTAALAAPAFTGGSGPEYLDRALNRSAELINSGALKQAEAVLVQLAGQYTDFTEVRLNLSTVYLQEKRPDDAVRILDESGEYRLFDAPRLFNYAMAFYQQGEYSEALVHLKKVLQQEPEMEEAWLYASECSLRLDDLKAAHYFAGQLSLMRPDSAAAHMQKARVHLAAMEYREALAELASARELEPDRGLEARIVSLEKDAMYYANKTGVRK